MLREHHVGICGRIGRSPRRGTGPRALASRDLGASDRIDVVHAVGGVLGQFSARKRRDRTCASRPALRSAGASWNTISTPSMVCVSIGSLDAARRRDQRDGARATASCRCRYRPGRAAPCGRRLPNWYCARRFIARAGQHALCDDRLHEPVRRDDLDLARAHVVLVDDALHAAVVIDVAMGDRSPPSPAAGPGCAW